MVLNLEIKTTRGLDDERDKLRGRIHYGIKPGDKDYERLSNAYKDLGKKVFELVAETYNRFIEFVRNNKGQYWLSKCLLDTNQMDKQIASFNIGSAAKVKSDSYNWVRWCPPFHYIIKVVFPDDNTFIKQEEWEQIKEFVNGNSRTDLVLELLSNAQSLLENGNRRSAIIEVVSALEIAIHKFAKSPKIPGTAIRERINTNNLLSQVKHLGLRVTVNYLLPILFPPDILTTGVLNQCQEALNLRNDIVHNGMRYVSEDRARPLIYSVIKVCKILMKYTNKER